MKKTEIEYFSQEDVAYIHLSAKKSLVGNEEFQDDVILYRIEDELVGIEIQNFYRSKTDTIKISDTKSLDFTKQFQIMRMLISLRDIIHNDPDQFKETLAEWGINIIEKTALKKFENTRKMDIMVPSPEVYSSIGAAR